MKKNKAMVGMSGGVDSSAAALLLQRQGYEVAGATFLLVDEAYPGCSPGQLEDARQVCRRLGIPHHVFDYRKAFRRRVVDYFADAYRRGETPNPCIACNREIKFGLFWEAAREMGYSHIATGHYARVEEDPAGNRWRLRQGADGAKDQSYVLYSLTQQQLAHILMPLGACRKEEIRRLVEEAGLKIAGKPDSQDICFVPDGDYASFLEAYTGQPPPPGNFVDSQGRILAPHRGLWRYTVGQRKGLGVSFGTPMYVSALDPETGDVALGDNAQLFQSRLAGRDARFLEGPPPSPLSCAAKIRYSAKPAPAQVQALAGGRVEVVFEQPVRAVTPGQAVVFYQGEYVVGGATIDNGE